MTDTAANPLIIALDALDADHCRELVSQLHGHVWGFKLNDMLHDSRLDDLIAHAPARWFFDAKLHDIPNTVSNTLRRLCERYAPDLVTIHASGGPEMMQAAVGTAREATDGKTQILAVTVLTSLDPPTCEAIYGRPPLDQVRNLAQMAKEAGCYGVVCSSLELETVAGIGINTVVPGIRPAWFTRESQAADDQVRIATPADAVAAGATRLVIGRPIVRAADPLDAVKRTLDEIADRQPA